MGCQSSKQNKTIISNTSVKTNTSNPSADNTLVKTNTTKVPLSVQVGGEKRLGQHFSTLIGWPLISNNVYLTTTYSQSLANYKNAFENVSSEAEYYAFAQDILEFISLTEQASTINEVIEQIMEKIQFYKNSIENEYQYLQQSLYLYSTITGLYIYKEALQYFEESKDKPILESTEFECFQRFICEHPSQTLLGQIYTPCVMMFLSFKPLLNTSLRLFCKNKLDSMEHQFAREVIKPSFERLYPTNKNYSMEQKVYFMKETLTEIHSDNLLDEIIKKMTYLTFFNICDPMFKFVK